MSWHAVSDYRADLGGLPRAEAADFLPVLPSPFTASVVRAGWEVARRSLVQRIGQALPLGWEEVEGQFAIMPEFWEIVAGALSVPADTLARVLGLPALQARGSGGNRRGILGLLRRRSEARNWQSDLAMGEKASREVARWHHRVRRLAWTQADILQVMEEIAPYAGRTLYAYAVATLALADTAASHPTDERQPLPEALPSLEPFQRFVHAMEDEQKGIDIAGLARAFPWWGAEPFEAASPRWHEDATGLESHARERRRSRSIPTLPRSTSANRQTSWAEALRAREAARVAFALVMSTARTWALVAASEAMEDGRLRAREQVFLLELEELKQMMTGEWSTAERVQAIVEERQEAWKARAGAVNSARPPDLEGTMMVVGERGVLPVPSPGDVVTAPGWHPGYAVAAWGANGLTSLSRGAFSYGSLLARELGIDVL